MQKSNSELEGKDSLFKYSDRNISASKYQKIELDISENSNAQRNFTYHKDFQGGIRCLKKVNSEIRQYKNRYNDDSFDREEPIMD